MATAPSVQTAKRARKANLLFLMADDHAGHVLGADGNRRARTPNLDRLASQGIRFANNFCNSPVCTPSRQSMLTGRMPHAAGVTVLRTALSPELPTLAKQLRAAGYRTGVIGKMHWNRTPEPGLHGFDWAMADRAAYDAHRGRGKESESGALGRPNQAALETVSRSSADLAQRRQASRQRLREGPSRNLYCFPGH